MQWLLRQERLIRGATLDEMAQIVGLSRSTLARTETGGLYGLRQFEQICQRLSVHPQDLLIIEGVPEPRQCPCCCHQSQPTISRRGPHAPPHDQ